MPQPQPHMQLKGHVQSILRLMRKNAIVTLLIAFALAFLLGAYAFRAVLFAPQPPAEVTSRPRATPGVPTLRHPLTGYPVSAAVVLPRVYAVMIDHMVDAWPQSGVDQAFLVIEAPVEAGIPRLEAFFSAEQNVQKIGPIRSARPYFIDWANEFSAMYTHVGGSDAALSALATGGTFDFNQFWNGTSFWRATDRQSPHNVYTSTQLLGAAWDRLAAQRKAPAVAYGTWMFKDANVLAPGQPVAPTVYLSTPDYRVRWEYDAKTGQYKRWQAGLPYAMQDGSSSEVDNVVIVTTNMRVIDEIGHREIRTIGEGDALVFQDGGVLQARWKKPSAGERLRFFDQKGTEIQMNAGRTWIEVVPSRDSVVY